MADDYYDVYVDDGVTDDVSNIVEPGAPLFLGTLSFCVCSLLVLPIFVAIGNRRARLRRARKEFESGGQVHNNLNTTLGDRSSFDEISADVCHGCNAIEDVLDDRGMAVGGCCISMMCDEQLADNVDEKSDNLTQEQHMGNNFDSSFTERRNRKRKSTEDITCSNDLDESKRTRRLLSDDTSSTGGARQHSFSFSIGKKHEHDERCKVTPDHTSTQDTSPEARGTRKKKKELFKRAMKAVTKKRPIQPLSQSQQIPKKTFLDGGFYAPGNLRLHHQILQYQLDRECRAAKKRMKKKNDKSYVPPSIPTTEADGFDLTRRDCSFDFDQDSVYTSTSSNADDREVINEIDLVFGEQSPYHPKKRKYIWKHFVRMAAFDHESKRLVNLMAPYTFTALIRNMFAIIEIAIISSVLGAESLSAFLVTGYFLSMVYTAAKGFTDAQATLCAHAVGAGNYFLAGQYIQLTQLVFVLTAFLPLLLMASFMYQLLVWFDVDSDVATLGGRFATVQVIALLVCGFNDAQMQFLSAIDPSNYSNAIEILMSASYTAAIAVYLRSSENATLVGLAWMKCCIAILFIPINIAVLSSRGWLDLCWVGMVRSSALKNREAVKQMFKTGAPLGIGSLIRESEWGILVFYASRIGTDDVATFAIIRRTFDIFSSLIEGLCCGAELRCAYHMGRGNQVLASRSAYKSLIIGVSVGTALAFAYYGLLGNYVFKLLDYDKIGAEMTELIPLLCLCSIVMTIGMLGWALLGAQGRVRMATFVSMVTSWIITIPIAAYFVVVRKYSLQGLVAAVTVGYSVSSTILMYLLIRSNWKKRSAKVMRITSFSDASFRDDELSISPSLCDYDDAAFSQVGSTPPTKDLTLSIQTILGSDSDVTEMIEQLGDAVPNSIRPDSPC